MKKTILMIMLAMASVSVFAQKTISKHSKIPFSTEKADSAMIIRTGLSGNTWLFVGHNKPDSLHVIVLNDHQLNMLGDVIKATGQLLSRSPDMTAYQSSEAQLKLTGLVQIISKQLELKPPQATK